MDFEQTLIIGRLGKDPEIRTLQSGKSVCNFSVAVGQGKNDDGSDRPTKWYRVAVWDKQAETCNQYLKKGQEVTVVGRVTANAYTDQSGKPAASLEITAQTVRFGSKTENGAAGKNGNGDFAPPPEDIGDLPF